MKERNVFLFLVVIIILTSLFLYYNIGYASVNLDEYTNNYSHQDFFISFDQNSKYIKNVNIITPQKATLNNINLSEFGEFQKFTIPVINTSKNTAARLETSILNSNTEYFNVTCQSSKTILEKNSDKAIIEVSVKLIKIPISSDETAQITININSESIY